MPLGLASFNLCSVNLMHAPTFFMKVLYGKPRSKILTNVDCGDSRKTLVFSLNQKCFSIINCVIMTTSLFGIHSGSIWTLVFTVKQRKYHTACVSSVHPELCSLLSSCWLFLGANSTQIAACTAEGAWLTLFLVLYSTYWLYLELHVHAGKDSVLVRLYISISCIESPIRDEPNWLSQGRVDMP